MHRNSLKPKIILFFKKNNTLKNAKDKNYMIASECLTAKITASYQVKYLWSKEQVFIYSTTAQQWGNTDNN